MFLPNHNWDGHNNPFILTEMFVKCQLNMSLYAECWQAKKEGKEAAYAQHSAWHMAGS